MKNCSCLHFPQLVYLEPWLLFIQEQPLSPLEAHLLHAGSLSYLHWSPTPRSSCPVAPLAAPQWALTQLESFRKTILYRVPQPLAQGQPQSLNSPC